ncbi:MAG: VWA domain-containing protein [Phycisphaerales bacterium]|nr:VWA domain-containing protein [Phycisphaerales bacterium]
MRLLPFAAAMVVASAVAADDAAPPSPGMPSEPAAPIGPPPADAPVVAPSPPSLAAAPKVERQTLESLLDSSSWARQAIGAMRLERYRCEESRTRLLAMLTSPSWPLRCFVIRVLALRGEALPEGFLDREENPRVVRTALRCRYEMNHDRLRRGIGTLRRSNDLADRMLSIELAAASSDPALADQAKEDLQTLVFRMGRIEGGVLSPRLAAVAGAPDLRRHYEWQEWLRKNRATLSLRPVHLVPERPPATPATGIAQLPPDAFAGLAEYMDQLGGRTIDLAIALDCTASMWGELAEAQGGIDDLMVFAGGITRGIRVGLVAYRDRRDKDFETKAWNFTESIEQARQRLWSLSADGGGDRPEAVQPALRLAYANLGWNRDHQRVLVLIGDAPPHVGYGAACVAMAKAGAEAGITTHVIQARLGRDRAGERTVDIEHFPEIAAAGNGRCVSMAEGNALIVEIAGLTIGERYQPELEEFFQTYLDLCR